jgi:3-oxoacyl-[acyl-carrier-protein] synthase III
LRTGHLAHQTGHPHQANRRIIDAVAERLGVNPEQVFVNLDRYGNTSAASVAIALTKRFRKAVFNAVTWCSRSCSVPV